MALEDRASLLARVVSLLTGTALVYKTDHKVLEDNIIDSTYNKVSDPVTLGQDVTGVALIIGDTLVAHTLGKGAKMVQFVDSDGNTRNFKWVAVSTTGITVTSTVALTGVTVKIIAY